MPNIYETLPRQTASGGCPGFEGVTYQQLPARWDRTVRETQRRVKPTGFSVTPLSVATTDNYRYGLYREDYDGTTWCGREKKAYRTSVFTGHNQIPLPPDPGPYNWEGELRSKIKKRSTNLGATCFEYRQTCGMFADAVTGAVDLYRKLRRGDLLGSTIGMSKRAKRKYLRKRSRRALRRLPKDLANANLLGSFGLVPLLSDLHSSLEQLNRLQVVKYMISTSGTLTSQKEYKSGGYFYSGTHVRSVRASCMITQSIENTGFTMGNPLEVAWELTPFSFVVDWLVPIGDYLSSLDAMSGVTSVLGTVTTRDHRETWAEALPVSSTGYRLSSVRGATFVSDSHQRTTFTSIPMGSLPGYEPSKSFSSVRNGLALLMQLK